MAEEKVLMFSSPPKISEMRLVRWWVHRAQKPKEGAPKPDIHECPLTTHKKLNIRRHCRCSPSPLLAIAVAHHRRRSPSPSLAITVARHRRHSPSPSLAIAVACHCHRWPSPSSLLPSLLPLYSWHLRGFCRVLYGSFIHRWCLPILEDSMGCKRGVILRVPLKTMDLEKILFRDRCQRILLKIHIHSYFTLQTLHD